MKKTLVLVYGTMAYLMFFGAILYLIGFTGNLMVPKGIDDGMETGLGTALAVNLALVLLFGVQHSVMARAAFKRWWTRYLPKPMERSTFVAVTCVILALMYWQWRPIPGTLWEVESTAGKAAVYALFALGWVLVFYASFLINHFDLFGLRQVVLHFRGRHYTHVPMKIMGLYKLVRHPLMLGFLIAFWATPAMTYGHLLFALAMSAYIFVGIHFEERTLNAELGPVYRAYQQRTPMILPKLPKPGAATDVQGMSDTTAAQEASNTR